MINLQRILFPTDFSSNANAALPYACAFAEQFDAELHLLHVYQDLALNLSGLDSGFYFGEDFLTKLRESAERELGGLLDSKWANGKRIVKATQQGAPYWEIVQYAKKHSVDLIVLGTHGRTGLAHMLLGSVAEKTVQNAHCPVLTIRPTGRQFVLPE